jgi:hypothetical protein
MKEKRGLLISPSRLLYHRENHSVDFDEIQQGDHATGGDIDGVLFRPVPSNIPK